MKLTQLKANEANLMQWKTPKNTDKYLWTAHVSEKMHYYGLSEQKVLGVIRNPKRIETGIVENTVAVMLPVGNIKKGDTKPKWGRPIFGNVQSEKEISEGKRKEEVWNQEIWVMYQLRGTGPSKLEQQIQKMVSKEKANKLMKLMPKKLIIISAWRYPGVSPKNNPIPEDILREIEEVALA
jgi:hypothetical protein